MARRIPEGKTRWAKGRATATDVHAVTGLTRRHDRTSRTAGQKESRVQEEGPRCPTGETPPPQSPPPSYRLPRKQSARPRNREGWSRLDRWSTTEISATAEVDGAVGHGADLVAEVGAAHDGPGCSRVDAEPRAMPVRPHRGPRRPQDVPVTRRRRCTRTTRRERQESGSSPRG